MNGLQFQPDARFEGGSAVEMKPTGWRLVVFTHPRERDAVLGIFQDVLSLNAIDARTRYHHLPGVLPDEFDSATASKCQAALERLGIAATTVPVGEVPDLRYPRRLHHVRCNPEGLVIVGLNDRPEETVAWKALALISVADVPSSSHSRTIPADGVFRHRPGIAETEPETSGRTVELWLICKNPFRAFYLDHELVNYEYLGSRRSTSAIVNFREFLRDLRRFAAWLFVTPTARAFMNQASVESYRLASSDAHREAVVLQTIVMRELSRERDACAVD